MAKQDIDWNLIIQAGIGLVTVSALVGGINYITGKEPAPPPKEVEQSNIRNNWKPFQLAKEIATNLQGNNLLVYPETAIKVLPLNKDEATWLNNYYNKTFYETDGKTISELFLTEWSDWTGTYKMAGNHMKSFGL